MEEKLIYSSSNALEADYICSVLKENNVTFVKRTEGAGDYLKIATGNLFSNATKIFVSDEDYEKAKELIENINNANEDFQTVECPDELKDISNEEEKEMDKEVQKTKKHLRMFIGGFILIPILIFIVAIIISKL